MCAPSSSPLCRRLCIVVCRDENAVIPEHHPACRHKGLPLTPAMPRGLLFTLQSSNAGSGNAPIIQGLWIPQSSSCRKPDHGKDCKQTYMGGSLLFTRIRMSHPSQQTASTTPHIAGFNPSLPPWTSAYGSARLGTHHVYGLCITDTPGRI